MLTIITYSQASNIADLPAVSTHCKRIIAKCIKRVARLKPGSSSKELRLNFDKWQHCFFTARAKGCILKRNC